MKKIIILPFLLLSLVLAGQTYRTQPLSPEMKTIQVDVNGERVQNPIINLNSNDYLTISFDRLSDDSFNRLRYKIAHCDADWKPSRNISEIDYLNGFNDNWIEDFLPSINTTVDFTHFSVNIPNRDLSVKLSGNYVVSVYEEQNPSLILLTACFSVLDSKVGISASVSTNTLIDSNRGHQQLSFSINNGSLQIRDPFSELKVFVQQNNRLDNELRNVKPTFVGGNRFLFENNRDLIFEAGNEYRRFETSSYRSNGMNVDHIEYTRPFYSVNIATDRIRANRSYSYTEDQNGMFFIRNREATNNDTRADYFLTTFTLASPTPLPQDIYINGDFTNNTFTDEYQMKYDYNKQAYTLTCLLKQGLYNYQYLPNVDNRFTTSVVEGNYFETENSYTILVYYRAIGQLYDTLVGIQTINSRTR